MSKIVSRLIDDLGNDLGEIVQADFDYQVDREMVCYKVYVALDEPWDDDE